MTTCQLCGLEKNLIKAHIIPRQLYKPIKESVSGVAQSEKNPWIYTLDEKKKPEQIQSGIYDDSILCSCCDCKVIGPWDEYGQKFLLSPEFISENRLTTNPDGSSFFEIETFDYPKLKLFFLSILWKSGITNKAFFSKVQLGSWEDRLKKMIQEQDPGLYTDFSVILFRYSGDFCEIMQNPTREIYEGVNYYRYRVPNYGFLIKVDQRVFPDEFNSFILSPNNKFLIRYKKYEESQEYKQILDTWEKFEK